MTGVHSLGNHPSLLSELKDIGVQTSYFKSPAIEDSTHFPNPPIESFLCEEKQHQCRRITCPKKCGEVYHECLSNVS